MIILSFHISAPLRAQQQQRAKLHHIDPKPESISSVDTIAIEEKAEVATSVIPPQSDDDVPEPIVTETIIDARSDSVSEEEVVDDGKLIDTVFDFIHVSDYNRVICLIILFQAADYTTTSSAASIERMVSAADLEANAAAVMATTGIVDSTTTNKSNTVLPHSVSFYRNVKNMRKQQLNTANSGIESRLPANDIGRTDNSRQSERAQFDLKIKVCIMVLTLSWVSHGIIDLYRKKTLSHVSCEISTNHLTFSPTFQLYNDAINVQQEQILQASRALAICHETHAFYGSREEVFFFIIYLSKVFVVRLMLNAHYYWLLNVVVHSSMNSNESPSHIVKSDQHWIVVRPVH